MVNVLLYIWQLPQNLLGLILRIFYKTDEKIIYKEKTIRICNKFRGGISLGETIFTYNHWNSNELWKSIKHEYGHSIQSRYLGWFYLLFIGLPSGIGYWIDRLFHQKWTPADRSKWYYNQPWEKWADKLGEVDR